MIATNLGDIEDEARVEGFLMTNPKNSEYLGINSFGCCGPGPILGAHHERRTTNATSRRPA
jgi:hypothetical protein